jgi:hypothetical protein
MAWWSTLKAVGSALGIGDSTVAPVGCSLGRSIYQETKRATLIVNVQRRPRPLPSSARALLAPLFPDLDLSTVRIRTSCRLPPNRFNTSGNIYAMTFGTTICWRDEFDEGDAVDLVKLAHELVHVDQVRRFGGESAFACAYGEGYLAGGGELPPYLRKLTAYHRNPLEAEAYQFESRFRDGNGRVVRDRLHHPPPG